ncbi:MAG: GNAT family N-acetyltransferase [Acetobacteraceae bacterium]|nr:GNAT family N-acetyltransferase [Acetobacteraceae bacterium]
MNPAWIVRTGRLLLTPVQWSDLPDLQAIKADPGVFALMLGGVRTPFRTEEELAADVQLWGARGFGIWAVRPLGGGPFLGLTGFMVRPDGRGIALRFGFWSRHRGHGVAREAAGAALNFGHDRAEIERVIAVARNTNFSSRTVLGSIGMREHAEFLQNGYQMIEYESLRRWRGDPIAG